MRRLMTLVALLMGVSTIVRTHDPNATITWNREISRIVYERCAVCHRPGGTAFSLMTYQDVQPRAAEVKAAVLSRRMPPWGAVKGFGEFRNDQGLTQEQIGLITDWIETGALRGNNPNVLPPMPKFDSANKIDIPNTGIEVSGEVTLRTSVVLDGIMPEHVQQQASIQIVAVKPDSSIAPLLCLYQYDDRYRHPFLFRKPITLPAGTVIRGVPPNATVKLIGIGRSTG